MQETFKVISPVDGSIYLERPYSNDQIIEKTLFEATRAQAEWSSSNVEDRARICQAAIDHLVERQQDIAKQITWQMGRPIVYSPFEIKNGLFERATYMINTAQSSLSDQTFNELSGFTRFIRKEPLGTVLVLAPWNYPFLTAVNSVIPALMAGNTVILKHSDQTPLCPEAFFEAFEHAGLPKGVFQYLHLTHDQVARIISDERIAHVSFTGSVEGGMAIQQAIGKRFISTGLELGGKDPAYVRADADLPSAIENLVDGAFFNSGQSCCGIERIYVNEHIYDDFIEGFRALTRKYVVGDPTDSKTTLGPMVRKSAVHNAKKQIVEAINKGAQCLISDGDFPYLEPPYMAPQILTNVDHTMAVMMEESFAPVVGIMRVKDDQEAIKFMNDSQYGLTASVWTSDRDKALEIGQQVQTGTFFMNRCDYLDPALAWTGIKNSGKGCTLSYLGYEHLTRPKSYHLKL